MQTRVSPAAFIHTAYCQVCVLLPHSQVKATLFPLRSGPHNTMRVCSTYVTLALGSGGFAQEVPQKNRSFAPRRWTDAVVKDKVLYWAAPLHYFSSTVSLPGRNPLLLHSCYRGVSTACNLVLHSHAAKETHAFVYFSRQTTSTESPFTLGI